MEKCPELLCTLKDLMTHTVKAREMKIRSSMLLAMSLVMGFSEICGPFALGQINYPLQIGNLWQSWESPDSLSFIESRVTGDTSMPNGLTYRTIRTINYYGSRQPLWYFFYRDSGNTRIYKYNPYAQKDVLQFDYSKNVGDTVSVYYPTPTAFGPDTSIVTVLETGSRLFFGQIRKYMRFYEKTVHATLYWIYEITDSIGMSFYQFEPGIQYALVGAVIRGKEYGKLLNVGATDQLPHAFILYQNYPNPFNPKTTIRFEISTNGRVRLTIWDVLGRLSKALLDKSLSAGTYSMEWDGRDDNGTELPSGAYFCRLQREHSSAVTKLLLIR